MKLPQTLLEKKHFPVMLKEVLKICLTKSGGIYLDCTFGGGGYSREILKYPNTNIIAIDRDKEVNPIAKNLSLKFPKRFKFHLSKFSNLDNFFNNKIDAAIFDLGISSIQLEDMSRGFSFKSKKKLDMSMGLTKLNAIDIINNLSEDQLKNIIKIFGEEKEAYRIAKNIVKKREFRKIEYVYELVEIIEQSKKKDFKKKINISAKTFQAIRIFVNKEISELINGIIKATKCLKPGGKIVIVSFHSIEDKIAKYFFKNFSINQSRSNKYLPEKKLDNPIFFEKYFNKIITPSSKEININPKSKSAKLRYAIRSNTPFFEPVEFRKKFSKYIEMENIND